jgi:hypothetical protein
MTSILDALQNQLGPDTIQQISEQIGSDPAATQSAIGMALPMLIGGLSHNASNPQGAAALNAALDQHDGGILDNLGGLLGGGGGGGLAGGIGGAILGHILGNKRGPAEAGVAKASGLDAAQVGQLLIMLAPIVMGVLGRMKQQKGIGADQLPDVLNQGKADLEAQNPGLGGLGGFFDQNHDGSIGDDVLRMGTSVLGGLFRK